MRLAQKGRFMLKPRQSGLVVALLSLAAPWAGAATGERAIGVGARTGRTGRAERWAVLIGVNAYEDTAAIPPLKWCVQDVKRLRNVLVTHGGFKPSSVLTLTDDASDPKRRPTRNNIIAQLSSWMALPKKDDLALVYFGGHGMLHRGKTYLVPADGRGANLALTAVPYGFVKEQLEACKAKQKLVILDACHSGSGRAIGAMGTGMRDELRAAQGIALMASCDANEKSYEWPAERHGVFSYYLTNALTGKSDRDGNGQVWFSEAAHYVWDRTRKWAAKRGLRQNPITHSTISGEFVLSSPGAVKPTRPVQVEHEAEVEKGKLSVKVIPAGAKVYIDDKQIGTAKKGYRLGITLRAGIHRIQAAMPGYRTSRQLVRVPTGATRRFTVTLKDTFLSGTWKGQFAYGKTYDFEHQKNPVYFYWNIGLSGTAVQGYSVEPRTFGPTDVSRLIAQLEGIYDPRSQAVGLTKTYQHATLQNYQIRYLFRVDPGGKLVRGTWEIIRSGRRTGQTGVFAAVRIKDEE